MIRTAGLRSHAGPPPEPPAEVTLRGCTSDNYDASWTWPNDTDDRMAEPFALGSNFYVTRLDWVAGSNFSGTPQVRYAVYSDAAGEPGSELFGKTASVSGAGLQTKSITLDGPEFLAAGSYWIVGYRTGGAGTMDVALENNSPHPTNTDCSFDTQVTDDGGSNWASMPTPRAAGYRVRGYFA